MPKNKSQRKRNRSRPTMTSKWISKTQGTKPKNAAQYRRVMQAGLTGRKVSVRLHKTNAIKRKVRRR